MNLRRSAIYNLVGHLGPLLAALFAIPVLIERLAAERFGFLSLAWVLVGYVGLLDLGLGRALTRVVAERTGTSREAGLAGLARAVYALLTGLGLLLGALLFAFSPWLCTSVLRVPVHMQAEATLALRILAACLPFVTLGSALRGLLEARHHFGWVNAIRLPLGVLSFVLPMLVALVTVDLAMVCLSLAALRVIGMAAHLFACRRSAPLLVSTGAPDWEGVREMFGYGAWLTVSNLVGPLLVYLDRFVIGALATLAAVAFYTAPYEVVTRLWLLPAALSGVLFPAFSASHATDPARVRKMYRTAVLAILLSVLPVALLGALFAEYWLTAWLGAEYAAQGARVAQILCAGIVVNSLAYVPFTLLQASGRADLAAKAHLFELPVYLAMLALLVSMAGIEGAAWAWALRCVLDAVILSVLAQRELRRARANLRIKSAEKA